MVNVKMNELNRIAVAAVKMKDLTPMFQKKRVSRRGSSASKSGRTGIMSTFRKSLQGAGFRNLALPS